MIYQVFKLSRKELILMTWNKTIYWSMFECRELIVRSTNASFSENVVSIEFLTSSHNLSMTIVIDAHSESSHLIQS